MEVESGDASHVGHASTAPPSTHSPSRQQPSPASDRFPLPDSPNPYHAAGATSPRQSGGQTIRVRDLAHIQSLARADLLTGNGPGILDDPPLQRMKYEISGMPIGDIIEMVAALLTKITTTNDLQHDAMNRNAAHQQQASQNQEAGNANQMSPLSTSVLAFHGKNVPAITILSYLSRIHKYCPTTYEVFLSLLVYFDRMTERVNDMVTKSEEAKRLAAMNPSAAPKVQPPPEEDMEMKDDDDVESDETDSDLADDDDEGDDLRKKSGEVSGTVVTGVGAPTSTSGPATYFVVDSFNIHRLIIAGVTCASKFFSDVFYTNSRYAKVCSTLNSSSLHVYVPEMLTQRQHTGRRLAPCRAQSSGAPVPPFERLPARSPCRRPGGVCHHARRVLRARSRRAAVEIGPGLGMT
jgi:PHO85 cyclin-6/7